MTKKTAANITTTTVGALKTALKRVTSSTGAKSASLAVDSTGLRVEAATGEGYASVLVKIDGIPGLPCQAQIGSSLVNIILSGEDADTVLTVAADEKGARIRYAGANLLLKKPEVNIEDLFAQTYRQMESTLITVITGEQLRAAAKSATQFKARNDIRFQFCGVHMVERSGKLTFEGTDGFAIHQHNTEHGVAAAALGLDVIIPATASEAMVSVFDSSESVTMESVGKSLIGFRTEDGYWVSNMISSKYPDCRNFFGNEEEARSKGVMMVLHRKSFLAALSRVSSVAQREGNYLRLVFDESGVKVTSTDGEQEDVVAAAMVSSAKGQHECHVTSSLALNTFDAVISDYFLLSKGPESLDKIYIRPAHQVESEWQFVQSWQAMMQPARF